MVKRKIKIAISSALILASTAVSADQCALVDCDCSAITEQRWQQLCIEQQRRVLADCEGNGGVAKSYCGLHGPQAFPIAVSIHPDKQEHILSSVDAEALNKQIKTQQWSLHESLATIKAKEASGQYGDAIQLLGLFEHETDRLYELQRQSLVTMVGSEQLRSAQNDAQQYARDLIQYAEQMKQYSASLWEKRLTSDPRDPRTGKAYRVMGLKLARMAAGIYEQSGDLLGLAQHNEAAARAWQSAAEMAQELIAMEAVTENKSRHIQFYQAQASARFHRATYYWLQTQSHQEQVEKTARMASALMTPNAQDQADAQFETAHDMDGQEMRAMTRPSR